MRIKLATRQWSSALLFAAMAVACYRPGLARAVTPAIPRTLIATDGLTREDVVAALDSFCKSEGCTVKYEDDYGPNWRIYIRRQQIGSISGPCDTFRWCLQSYEFPQANAFWSNDRVKLLRRQLAKRGGSALRVHCGPRNGVYACDDGNDGHLPVSPVKRAYAKQRLESLWPMDRGPQHGTVWVLGLPQATATNIQLIIERFCAKSGCYAVRHHVSKQHRSMFTSLGFKVPEPSWFMFSSIDNADVGNLDDHCPPKHNDAYCLWVMYARGDAFWTAARVAQLRAAFDAADIPTEPLDCRAGERGGGQSLSEVCKEKPAERAAGH